MLIENKHGLLFFGLICSGLSLMTYFDDAEIATAEPTIAQTIIVKQMSVSTPIYDAVIDCEHKRLVSISGTLSPDHIIDPIPKSKTIRRYWGSPETTPYLLDQTGLPLHDYSHCWAVHWASNRDDFYYVNNWINVVPEYPRINRHYVRMVESRFVDIVREKGVSKIDIKFYYNEAEQIHYLREMTITNGEFTESYHIPNLPDEFMKMNWQELRVKEQHDAN